MEFLQSYFPTTRLKRIEARLNGLLDREIRRLQSLGGIDSDNLAATLPAIQDFTGKYHELFAEYLSETLPQHREPIQCGPGCANCCHHFPMSVEPFELLHFYASLRTEARLADYLEACLARVRAFGRLATDLQQALEPVTSTSEPDDEEERRLHAFFSLGLPCPFVAFSGDCGVYALRPVTCRMYFSTTAPQFCVPEHLQTPANRSFIVYLPDSVEEKIAEVSDFYQALDLPEGLYPGLLAMNALEGYFPHDH